MEDVNTAKVIDIINGKLEHLKKLWELKNAEEIVNNFYLENTQISGQGVKSLFTGKSNLTELVSALVNDSTSADLSIYKFNAISSECIVTWVNWTVYFDNDLEPMKLKSLFVWELNEDDWFITADMYADEHLV